MKNLKMVRLLTCGLLSLLMCSVANAKTEKITLKRPIDFGGEAVIFNTTKGEVILNLYALPALLHKDLKCKAPLIEPNLRRNLDKWST
ncbi:hypothetical protein ACLD0I_17895 [Acinetobacter baumannii]|uniref:hypothetical protein n=1 Tax=Acinetobacter baumannii TaxID=470 RepID=UPI0020CFE06B|nr:hypothetical protein [Acinetobacter baumannii]MCQ1048931.1 hypothetical protein [Acinetobacter baumannii]MDA3535501.1 hypothetical protein [Acinetobacter baumannii]MDV4237489.1 hypothetical protein [Acinetobacter baumannii]